MWTSICALALGPANVRGGSGDVRKPVMLETIFAPQGENLPDNRANSDKSRAKKWRMRLRTSDMINVSGS